MTGWFFIFLFVCMENYSGSVIITQEKSVLQKTAHSHIQKEETQKLIRRKLAVGWKLKVTHPPYPINEFDKWIVKGFPQWQEQQ